MARSGNSAMTDQMTCPRCAGLGYLTEAQTTVGDLILLHRNKIGITQMELALQVGVSRPQVANIESGRSDPPISTLRRYAIALQCSVKDLIP